MKTAGISYLTPNNSEDNTLGDEHLNKSLQEPLS